MVSAAAPASPRCHSRVAAGRMADALSQSESASSSATARESTARHLAAGRGLDDTASTMPQPIAPGNDTRPGAHAREPCRRDDRLRHDNLEKRP